MAAFRHELPPRRPRWFLPVILLAVLIAGGLLLRHFPGTATSPAPAEAPRQLRAVTLYFAAADGSGLVAETRDIAGCGAEPECLAGTVEALLGGPVGSLAPVFPPRTTLRGIAVAGDEVQVDFGRDLVEGHPGGSRWELLTVQALAGTVAGNFPHLRQVRLLVEGNAVETLKGHVDLRQPIRPDFTLVLKAAAGGTGTTPAGRPQ
ncbi:MAG: GerMN domain-containing protein [Deltaproteobacteria bacterium]|nr:MAG: GerMN domain-containing protein [Deltaproteobacteria bacterium]